MSADNPLDDEHARRLQALEDRIQDLERRLDGHHHGGSGPEYYESGTVHPELDDQTIAP
jgi:hypothetical protein